MRFRKILITGGAGFVGSSLAVRFKQFSSDIEVIAFDNLKRRGSEWNLARIKQHGAKFIHGDIRNAEDLDLVGKVDLIIDCAAEPSVHAGTDGRPAQVINTNLNGTINCLDFAHQNDAAFLFLSTSRVYPIEKLNAMPFVEMETRFEWTSNDEPGFSPNGITEHFTLDGARSFYGSSKLASELLIREYAYNYQLPGLINRCGILTGPWQMGKVDQGVVMLWVARHLMNQPLTYMGFGGKGKQVRDMLHVDDLFELLIRQMKEISAWQGDVFQVGGGRKISASLQELTTICQEVTGQKVEIGQQPVTNPVDLRIFLADCDTTQVRFGWKPQKNVVTIVSEISTWIQENLEQVRSVMLA